MPDPTPTSRKRSKLPPAAILLGSLVILVIILGQPGSFLAQAPTGTPTRQLLPTQPPVMTGTLTPTINPIPELNPNPRQTDGVILGAAVIIFVIVAGIWTYGRRRKE